MHAATKDLVGSILQTTASGEAREQHVCYETAMALLGRPAPDADLASARVLALGLLQGLALPARATTETVTVLRTLLGTAHIFPAFLEAAAREQTEAPVSGWEALCDGALMRWRAKLS